MKIIIEEHEGSYCLLINSPGGSRVRRFEGIHAEPVKIAVKILHRISELNRPKVTDVLDSVVQHVRNNNNEGK